jgi:hypothetical protein
MSDPFQQDPADVVDYPVDLSSELGGDTITGAAADIDAGLTATISYSGSIVTVTVGPGGVPGNTYGVRIRAMTSSSQVDETLSFYILPPTPDTDGVLAGSGQLQG